MFDVIKEILMSNKEFTETNYKRLLKVLVYIENNLIDCDGGMYLTGDSLIVINNIITGLNNITLRIVNVKPYGFDKMYMDKEIIEDIERKRKITSTKFYSILSNKVHPYHHGNGRTCKILLANDDIIWQNIQTNLSYI